MQTLTTLRQRLLSRDMLIGTAVILTVVILLVALFAIYLKQPGKKALRFEVTDASSISTGADVRVAGIGVGKVTNVSIQPEHVLVEARIDGSTFIGDQATVDVRMLTPVGGYAITLIPRGTRESSATIPADRVTVPYSIGDVIQAAPHTTDDIETPIWHSNIQQVADAFGENDTSLRSIVDGLDSVSRVFAKQRTQVHDVASLASQYLNTFNTNREFVFALVNKINEVVTEYHINSAGFNRAYLLMSRVLNKLGPSFRLYLKNSDVLEEQVTSVLSSIRGIIKEMGPTINGLIGLRDQLKTWLTPQGMRELGNGQLSLENLCVPLQGRSC